MRRVLLMGSDALVIAASIVLASVVRLAPHEMKWGIYLQEHVYAFTSAGIIFLLVMYAAGLYERQALVRNEGSQRTQRGQPEAKLLVQ